MPEGLPRQADNLTGKRYGKLVVLAFSHSHQGCYWHCECDCGNHGVYYAASLKRGTTRSCGCLAADLAAEKARKTGYASLWKRAAYNYRNGASQRGIVFDLTDEETISLMKQDCHYCKSPPSNITHGGRNKNHWIIHSGIDRVMNDIGYVSGNVVPCCKVCNYAKRDMTEREFLVWIHQVARHTNEPEFDLSDLTPIDRKRHAVIDDVLELYAD